mgnify:CR=1 FL=1
MIVSLTAVAERVLVRFDSAQHPQLDRAFAAGPLSTIGSWTTFVPVEAVSIRSTSHSRSTAS